MKNPLHADSPQGHDRLHRLAQEGLQIPELDDAGARAGDHHGVVEEQGRHEGLCGVPGDLVLLLYNFFLRCLKLRTNMLHCMPLASRTSLV
jgi:hypothetical protein